MHILILHGVQSHAGDHWQRWLKNELEDRKHTVHMPELPAADHPDRFEWLSFMKKITSDIPSSKLIIVGHSLGVVTALDFIEQSDKKIHGLISVSGFAEDYGSDINGFFMRQKDIDFAKIHDNLEHAIVLYGEDDPYVTGDALKNLPDRLNITPEIIIRGGHLNTEAGFSTFPRLLEIIQKLTLKKR